MTDFGTDEERGDALRISLACKELNDAIGAASFFVRVVDIYRASADTRSYIQVECMELRTMILPTALKSDNIKPDPMKYRMDGSQNWQA